MLNLRNMTKDALRREEFLAYFQKHIKDRKVLLDSGISKGRVTQYFDEGEVFGERAATNLEDKLKVVRGTIFPSLRPQSGLAMANNDRKGRVPVVGTAQLGDNCNFYDLEHPAGHGDGSLRWHTNDLNAYSLRCRGESMKPRIRHGEYVVIEPNREVIPGDEVLVKARDGRVMVKQLAYTRDGMVHLDSINEAHPRVSILETDISVLHYVAGIAKNALWNED